MIQSVAGLCVFLTLCMVVDADVNCPDTNGTVPEIISDPTNCTKFYICDSGKPYPQNCSGGLFFNPELNVCDREANVVYCEYDDLLYIKSYCDCRHYVTCDYGNLTVRACPEGYFFDRASSSYDGDDPCEPGDCG